MKSVIYFVMIVLLIAGCGPRQPETPAFDLTSMDLITRPGDDFYQYVNGNWLNKNPIPDDYSFWNSFSCLLEDNFEKLRSIMEDAAQDIKAVKGSNRQKMGDFYASGMDTLAIRRAGLTPLAPEFNAIAALGSMSNLQPVIAQLHRQGIPVFFSIYREQDPKNSVMVIAWLGQGGYTLPDRDYYLMQDERSQTIRSTYTAHIRRMFELLGDTPQQAEQAMKHVMQIETRLAQAALTNVELRDPQVACNRMDIAGLQKIAPQFDWPGYFNAIGLARIDTLNVAQVRFFRGLSDLLAGTQPAACRDYLRWHLIKSTAVLLDTAFVNEEFNFNGKFLRGIPSQRPRWKRVLNNTSNSLGEIVGQIYVENYFPPVARQRAIELVENL